MLAADYPLLNAFWTMLLLFGFIIWLWVLFTVLVDVFRSRDLSGVGKAGWFLLILFVPVIGVLAYLIVRGDKMHQHAIQEAEARDAAFRDYVQRAAAETGTSVGGTTVGGTTVGATTADELSKLAGLRDHGVISAEEFEREKAKILA